MPIVKLKKDNIPFDVVPREVIELLRSADAMAMYILLLTRPENWVVRKTWLKERLGIGEDRYNKARKELEALGIWESQLSRDEHGRMSGKEVHFHVLPTASPKYRKTHTSGKPNFGKTEASETSNFGKTDHLKNKDILNNKDYKENVICDSSEEEVTLNKPKKTKIPFQEIVNLYHELLPELPKVEKLTENRKSLIRQRFIQDLKDLNQWENYFDFVHQSDFLMGRVDPQNGRRVFRADLEWLVRPGNFAKIAEEKYHG